MEDISTKIREAEIEDALVAHIEILKSVLGISAREAHLIGRQIHLKDGTKRLDILLAVEDQIYLIELKVEPFAPEFLHQILEYRDELVHWQEDRKLIAGAIIPILLVTKAKKSHIDQCSASGVQLIDYSPLDILTRYFAKMSQIATFLKLRPVDLGVFNIGLINRAMKAMSEGRTTLSDITKASGLKERSIEHHLAFASQLGLAIKMNGGHFLTSYGQKYIDATDKTLPVENLSDRQSFLLRYFVAEDPFYSPIVFGIYSIVESAFFLSRNTYPISLADLRNLFQRISGKMYEWKAKKTLSTATYTFLNYGVILGLLGKIGKKVVITPAGFRFMLMLQLHKSIEMVDSLSIPAPD